MSAETVRLLHLVLDKLDRLADKGDEADWRAVAAIVLEETRDADYHPRPSRLREILAIAERHMIKGVPPVKPNVETERKVKRDVVPAPDALGERAPDYTAMDGPTMLDACRDDASKWAAAFCQTCKKLGHHVPNEGWMIGWFANAIEHSHAVRQSPDAGWRPIESADGGPKASEAEQRQYLRARSTGGET